MSVALHSGCPYVGWGMLSGVLTWQGTNLRDAEYHMKIELMSNRVLNKARRGHLRICSWPEAMASSLAGHHHTVLVPMELPRAWGSGWPSYLLPAGGEMGPGCQVLPWQMSIKSPHGPSTGQPPAHMLLWHWNRQRSWISLKVMWQEWDGQCLLLDLPHYPLIK